VKYFAECELATDSEDGVEDRPLFRRVFQNPEAAKTDTVDLTPMYETEEDDVAGQSTSQRRQFPICAPPDEPLAEWEDGVLDQVLTEIQGTGWDGSFMEELTSSTSTVTVPLDELAPLPEGWTGTDELRQLPASAISLIAERAAGQAGRGHRVRFALKGRNGTTSSR